MLRNGVRVGVLSKSSDLRNDVDEYSRGWRISRSLKGNDALLPKSSLGVGVPPLVGDVSDLPPMALPTPLLPSPLRKSLPRPLPRLLLLPPRKTLCISRTVWEGILELLRLWPPPGGRGIGARFVGELLRLKGPKESDRGRRTGETSRELLGGGES